MVNFWHVLVLAGLVRTEVLNSDDNYVKPWLERNKVNKGIWLRNRPKTTFEKTSLGAFIFRPDSLDGESVVHNAFDVLSSRQDGTMSGFFERDKRSPHSQNKHRHRKSLNNKTRIAPNRLPSIFNDDQYVLIDNPNNKNADYNIYPKYQTVTPEDRNGTVKDIKDLKVNNDKDKKDSIKKETNNTIEYLTDTINVTKGNVSTPKRSMNYGSDIERINFLDDFKQSKEAHDIESLKGDRMWQTAPVPDVSTTAHEVSPKVDQNNKPVSERGLIKVLSMLTKTFRKIMKHHSDIKAMHTEIQKFDEEFKKNVETHAKKIEDFDAKYAFFLKIIEKIKALQEKLKSKEESFKKKDEEVSMNLIKFEKQQKKFLAQQQQFYNVQKLMLAQNEKINQNQNQIARTQNEISQRQNNFARVLKKAKQLYMENKIPKLTTAVPKSKEESKNVTKAIKVEDPTQATTTTSTESVKINLFSIPPSDPVINQDQLILKEKDDKPIDDLIYKYYFNNTFIDSFLRNKLLSGIFNGDKLTLARNVKRKRNKHKTYNANNKLNITILLPVYNETKPNATLHRERRWINHHSKRKHRRKQRGKGQSSTNSEPLNTQTNLTIVTEQPAKVTDNSVKDPFVLMASKFCKEIGQNTTKQILDWCVEKALRRLKSLDTKLVPPSPLINKAGAPIQTTDSTSAHTKTPETPNRITPGIFTTGTEHTKTTPKSLLTTTPKNEKVNDPTASEFDLFFPDNDELESNLKQFDLTKDTVGNYYYDGSLHESDLK